MSERCWVLTDLGGIKPWQAAITLRGMKIEGVLEVFPAIDSIGVETSEAFVGPSGEFHLLPNAEFVSRTLEVPICFGEEFGPDFDQASTELGISPAKFIAALESATFEVAAVGFTPGFPYLMGLPHELCGLPRRSSPRTRVPSGSFGITGAQAGIYPTQTPGGWQLLGQTPCKIVDIDLPWFAFRAGDQVQIKSVSAQEFKDRIGEPLMPK